MEDMRSLTSPNVHMNSSIRRKAVASQSSAPFNSGSSTYPLHDYVQVTDTEDDFDGSQTQKDKPLARPHVVNGFLHRTWLVEVVSCAIALISLAGIIITLAKHQNRPLPQWPLHITINALISIFTTIFKFAMMVPISEGISQLKWLWYTRPHALVDLNRFDKASRGPWGAFLLLCRPVKQYLAVLGAVITIAALAIDPFSQLILTTYSCPAINDKAVAWISRTNNYTAAGVYTGAHLSSLDAPMTIAINEGLMYDNLNATTNVQFSCASGNCTFQDYDGASHSSIAMCHSCKDISNTIVNISATDGPAYALPGNTSLIWSETVLNVTQPTGQGLFGLDVLMFNATFNAFAYSCNIYPCVKTYWSNISESLLQERELSSSPLIYANSVVLGDGGYWDWWSLANDTTLRQQGWGNCNISDHYDSSTQVAVVSANKTVAASSSTGEWQSQLETYPNGSLSYYSPDCVWLLGPMTVQSLTGNLPTLLGNNGDWSLTVDDNTGLGIYGAAGPIWCENLWHNGSATMATMDAWWASLANSMTATMRSNGETSVANYVQGTAFVETVCIGVRWAWLSLAATLVFLVVVFQTLMILQTHESSIPKSWKSSILPLLYHGASEDIRQKYVGLDQVEEMEASARSTRVQLSPAERNWTLIERE